MQIFAERKDFWKLFLRFDDFSALNHKKPARKFALVCASDESLRAPDKFQQARLALAVKFGKNVVQKQNWIFPTFFFHVFKFGKFQRKRNCALLPLRAKIFHFNIVQKNVDVVSVSADGGVAKFEIFF